VVRIRVDKSKESCVPIGLGAYCGVARLQHPESRSSCTLGFGDWGRQATHTPLHCLNFNCVTSLSTFHVECFSLTSVNAECSSLSNVHVESCFAVSVASLPNVHFDCGISVAARFGSLRQPVQNIAEIRADSRLLRELSSGAQSC